MIACGNGSLEVVQFLTTPNEEGRVLVDLILDREEAERAFELAFCGGHVGVVKFFASFQDAEGKLLMLDFKSYHHCHSVAEEEEMQMNKSHGHSNMFLVFLAVRCFYSNTTRQNHSYQLVLGSVFIRFEAM